ncbi:MAG: TRAM domain-containing protein [Haloferacaceae archaeon]
MQLPTSLRCLFSGRVEVRDGSYVIEVPRDEIELGDIEAGGVYRVGVLGRPAESETAESSAERSDSSDGPPVSEGEVREVEIEDVGDQGDGLARVGPGYVVFVPGASVGDRPTVRITSARENVAFAEKIG